MDATGTQANRGWQWPSSDLHGETVNEQYSQTNENTDKLIVAAEGKEVSGQLQQRCDSVILLSRVTAMVTTNLHARVLYVHFALFSDEV